MKKIIYGLITLGIALIALTGCSDDSAVESLADTDVLFSYVTDSYHVDFTNESTATGSYLWDFGDNTTSTEENPSHDYLTKGDYYVTLKIGDKSIFTKIKIDKSSNIDLEDNSFADWDDIENAYIPNPEHECGVVQQFKYDYDSDYIYFYLQVDTPDSTDYQVFDMLIDVDPEEVTGFEYGIWPSFGGGEILIEDGFSADRDGNEDYFLDFANYDSEGTDWDTTWIYAGEDTEGHQVDGTYLAEGSIVQLEFAVSRTAIEALRDVNIIKVAGWTSNPDWDENGWFPCKMPDDATGTTPLADGFIINME